MATAQFGRGWLKSSFEGKFEGKRGGTEDPWGLCDLGEVDTGTIQ